MIKISLTIPSASKRKFRGIQRRKRQEGFFKWLI